jgi:hypothetical protein
MITDNLFAEILLRPAQEGSTELLIVSGYAGATLAYRHLEEDVIARNNVRVKLVVGMAAKDGILSTDHQGFRRLEIGGLFECHYRINQPAVHSKVYIWMADGEPVQAFVGSANYSQQGFGLIGRQQEAMAEADARRAFDYFENVRQGAMEIGHDDIAMHVRFHNEGQQANANNDCILVPLYSLRTDEVQESAGLNWGYRQQPGYNRNLNEAYIQIGAQLGREDFFPPRPARFTVITDSGESFIAVRAQKSEGGDAVETPENNALLGEYFRARMGLPDGEFITRELLENYGRTDIEFCKIDDDTFLMDFSV